MPPISPIFNMSDLETAQQTFVENVEAMKTSLLQENLTESTSPVSEHPLAEKAREYGSVIAHEALDKIAELIEPLPQFLSQIEHLSSKILPEPTTPLEIDPLKSYQDKVTSLHDKIDLAFDTVYADQYTPEYKANAPENLFQVGVLPPPGFLSGIFGDTRALSAAGQVFDRAGLTKAGRGLMKHGYREGSAFPKPIGNPAQVNEHGQRILEDY